MCTEKDSGTYRSLHYPNFSFEERDETDDDFHCVAKGIVQNTGKSLPKR
jgi:hypothetical protein